MKGIVAEWINYRHYQIVWFSHKAAELFDGSEVKSYSVVFTWQHTPVNTV